MGKQEVYFSKEFQKVLDRLEQQLQSLGERVGIKTHFGEEDCDTYINPEYVRALYDKLIDLGKKPVLIECNVLYKGKRTHASSHKKLAEKHGFDFADIDILDGEDGEKYIKLPLNNENSVVDKAKIGAGIKNYDSIVVLSHFKGHIAAGYGGAFKNLGMGLGSRAGKLHMHSDVNPSIDKDKCIACGKCIENCDFDAISYVESRPNEGGNKKAEINPEKCSGCAMCIAVCPQHAVQIPWGGSTSEDLQKKISDYSSSIINYLNQKDNKRENNFVYINVLENITSNCDCEKGHQDPIMEDIGIMSSKDPVALDKASLDMADEKSNGKFDGINSIDKTVQIEHACKLGLGNKDYEIVFLDSE
ncbi:MAG: DUF362 domain-containing protein [archaeon]